MFCNSSHFEITVETFLCIKLNAMNDFFAKYKWKLLGVTLGAVAGFAYWYFIGCNSGTCPIQSNWHTSTLYGGFIGYILPKSPKKDSGNKELENSEDK